MAKAAGQTVPDLEPITREEYFLNQIAENGGGGGLPTITEADEGKVLTVDDGEAVWASGGGSGATITIVEAVYDEVVEGMVIQTKASALATLFNNGVVLVHSTNEDEDEQYDMITSTIIAPDGYHNFIVKGITFSCNSGDDYPAAL